MSEDFFLDPTKYDVELAASGPKEWQRIENEDLDNGATPPETVLEPVAVSNITTDDDRISFYVDKIGVPVLVKASYFPNWEASGAQGPWRVAPNLMVVVPTSEHVSLHYGRTPIDLFAAFLTLLGIVGVVWLARRPPLVFPAPPARPFAEGTEPGRTGPVEWDSWDEWDEVEQDPFVETLSGAGIDPTTQPDPAMWMEDEAAPWRAAGVRNPPNR